MEATAIEEAAWEAVQVAVTTLLTIGLLAWAGLVLIVIIWAVNELTRKPW